MNKKVISSKTNTICCDSIKFFGAFIIAFVWHYGHFKPAGNPFDGIFIFSYAYGWLMVELFFMLSGFGMMIGYGRRVLCHLISFPQYMKKRLEKIYPLFFLTLIIVTLLEIIFKVKTGETFVYPNFDLFHFFLNLCIMHDGLFGIEWSYNAPSWCISICFILYVIFFTVFYFSKTERAATYKFACLGMFGAVVFIMGWSYPVLNTLVARGLFCFSIGVMLGYFYQSEHVFNTGLIGYLCFIALIGCYMVYRVKPSAVGNVHMMFILFVAPMIIVCVIFVPWINRMLSMQFFTYLGSLSMEIYLFHFPVQCVIKNIDLYCNLELNYSSREIWLIYVTSTILVSILYKQFLAAKNTEFFIKICDSIIQR